MNDELMNIYVYIYIYNLIWFPGLMIINIKDAQVLYKI